MEATPRLPGRPRETRRLREEKKRRGGRGAGKTGWRRGSARVIFDVFIKRTCLFFPPRSHPMACKIFVSRQGIEPLGPTVEKESFFFFF